MTVNEHSSDFYWAMLLFNSKTIFTVLILVGILLTNTSEGNSAKNFYKQGFNLSIEGKTQAAIQAYLKVLQIKPDDAETHHALGVLYFESGAGAKAIDHFKKAELFYKNRNDRQAKPNLIIIKNNLKKAYKELELNPNDFKFDTLLSTKVGWKSSGVGFLIGDQGYLFTSASAINGANKIRIRFLNGKTSPVKIIREFIVYKIAILKLNKPAKNLIHPLAFEDNPNFEEGNTVYAMDFSKIATENYFLTKGKILKENALENSDKIVQLDLDLKEGENGGPLFNEKGKLIGLILTKFIAQNSFAYLKDAPENASFAIKSSYLERILSGLTETKKQGKNQIIKTDLNSGINVKKISQEAIKNFIFLEISN